jgi:hypothetical protein
LGLFVEPLFVVTSSAYFGNKFSEICVSFILFKLMMFLGSMHYFIVSLPLSTIKSSITFWLANPQKYILRGYDHFFKRTLLFHLRPFCQARGKKYNITKISVFLGTRSLYPEGNSRENAQPKIMNSDILVILDGTDQYSTLLVVVLIIYIFLELFCVALVSVTFKLLKQHFTTLSETTYKLHLQVRQTDVV